MNKQIDLFGKETDQPIENKKPRTIKEKFRAKYGYKKDELCGECKYITRGKYKKCCKLGDTNSQATDISLKDIACSLFEKSW